MHEPPRHSQTADALKAFAILGVVLIHVSAPGCRNDVGSFNWYSALFWGSLTRASVPIFFMVTGALMLDPNRAVTIKQLWTRNIPRLLLSLLVWSFAYKLHALLTEQGLSAAALVQALKEVLLFRHQNHLYYLQIALLIYALLPATRILAAGAGKKTLEYLLCLWFLLGILYPTCKEIWPLNLLRGIPLQYGLNLTYTGIGYGLLGWYLRNYALSPKKWITLAGAGFFVTYAVTAALSLSKGELAVSWLEGASPGVAMLGAGVCGAVFSGLQDRPVPKAVHVLAKASFCIYLTHLFPLKSLSRRGINALAGPCAVSIPLTAAAIVLISLVFWAVLRRIPAVREWLI